ncbi:MAG TPA: serine/threonine-protein kinase [Vicinamibacteria bacterium]|nr:serine/threonine-protein kinase [Vicinamibacteria bacterium]
MSSQPERIGKYEILSELGRGAMGTVYKARDPSLDRLVAVKMMSEELLIEKEMRARFDREARSAANLQHPNIVTVFDFGELEPDGVPYIVMELLDGVSLAQLMESHGPERLQDKIDIILQICRGLDFAHKRGVIHRDVKPGNIQVLPDGTAKILDFGVAQMSGPTKDFKTKTGLVLGTPNYMAPEQISTDTVDHRADMWAVGVIAYELLTGERPFVATTVASLVYQIVHATPRPMDGRKLGLPPDLVNTIDRILVKQPNGRFRDLAETANAIENAMGAPSSFKELSNEARARGYRTNLELAKSLLFGGQPQRALEAARRAQALEPSHGSVVDLIHEIEVALVDIQTEPTLFNEASAPPSSEASRWVDEARMALTAGERSEALRIVEDVLSLTPGFEPALELRELLQKPGRPGRVRTGSLRPQTYRLARVRPTFTYKQIASFGEPPGVQVIAMGPRTQLVAAGGIDGSVRLWDIESKRKLTSFRTALHQRAGHEALVTSLAFSPDGAFLASGHVDGKVHLWSLDTGQEIPVRLRHDDSIGQVAFSPDGETLASGGLDSTLKLWKLSQLRRGEAERRLIRQPSGVTSLAYSHDGVHLISGHTNRVLRVHDARTGRLTATLRGHGAAVSVIAVSPDGDFIATGGRDCTVHMFDLLRREEGKPLTGHKKSIAGLAYFPGGAELASVAMDSSLVIWNADTATARATLWGGPDDCFVGVCITSGDEPWIVAGLGDGGIRIWAPE